MLGVQFGEILHALRMTYVFVFMMAMLIKQVDPTTIPLGSAEWIQYVKDNHRGW